MARYSRNIARSTLQRRMRVSPGSKSKIRNLGLAMAGIAKNIELYNLAYRLASKHISERQKREYPNVTTYLHDAIRRQLTEGASDPVLIATEALKNVEKLTDQIDSDAPDKPQR
jgi:hypothetical protein